MIWPRELAPADVHLVAAGKDEAILAEAERLTAELEKRGLSVLLDDRARVSPGVKFKDAELIGVPRSSWSAAGWPTVSSRSRTGAPASANRWRSPGPSTTSWSWCVVDKGPVEAVIFDWGGTLTPWHTVDYRRSGGRWRPSTREQAATWRR
jgi:hypothetical protein